MNCAPPPPAAAAPPRSAVAFMLAVLSTPVAATKAALARDALCAWQTGTLPPFADGDGEPPPRPARDDSLATCEPADAPRRGRGGSLASRVALLHSLAHIESWAIDLAADLVARFGRAENLPPAFYGDWLEVAAEEATHHEALVARLTACGSFYGALPSHNGLWQSAEATSFSCRARLAVEHCVHEARGMDVLPQTIARFRSGGDAATADLLESIILPQEVDHCRKGVTWFTWLVQREVEKDIGGVGCGANGGCGAAVCAAFWADVAAHFRGSLKPPFNEAARAEAGFPRDWYTDAPAIVLEQPLTG